MTEKYNESEVTENEEQHESLAPGERITTPEENAEDVVHLHEQIAEYEEFLESERTRLEEVRTNGEVSEVIGAEFVVMELSEEIEGLRAYLEALEEGQERRTKPMK